MIQAATGDWLPYDIFFYFLLSEIYVPALQIAGPNSK